MNILLLNPNTRADITDLMLKVGQRAAAPGTSLTPLTAPRGVPYISTRAEAQIGGAVALARMTAARWRTGRSYGAPMAGWLLVPAALAAHAAGEMVGYWRLLGNIEATYEFFELHRIACVRPEERSLMTTRGDATARSAAPAALDAGQRAEV